MLSIEAPQHGGMDTHTVGIGLWLYVHIPTVHSVVMWYVLLLVGVTSVDVCSAPCNTIM